MSTTTTKPKAIMCWSGGKDSAMALHRACIDFEVVSLLTTMNAEFKRISMHGVRETMLDAQAESIDLPLLKVWVKTGSYDEYEQQMRECMETAKSEGVTHIIYGDIFLQDLRDYRERQLEKVGLKAVFPLWQSNTSALIQTFIQSGFKTVTCCINDGYLDESWVGRDINADFVAELPIHVDPCGENGEYHTYCYAGPIFKHEIDFTRGEVVYKPLDKPMPVTKKEDSDTDRYDCKSAVETKGFWFCDLL